MTFGASLGCAATSSARTVYTPTTFAESDREVLFELIEAYGFATVVSSTAVGPVVSHVPLLLDRSVPGRERLLGHVAKANPHWKQFDGQVPLLAIFHAPNAYVSSAWYTSSPSVPTWNYAVAHVHGSARVVDVELTESILRRLVEKYEGPRANRWAGDLPVAFVHQELRAIVGFELEIARIEGKFKLSQNKDPADRDGVLAGLASEPDSASRELASFAKKYYARRGDR